MDPMKCESQYSLAELLHYNFNDTENAILHYSKCIENYTNNIAEIKDKVDHDSSLSKMVSSAYSNWGTILLAKALNCNLRNKDGNSIYGIIKRSDDVGDYDVLVINLSLNKV